MFTLQTSFKPLLLWGRGGGGRGKNPSIGDWIERKKTLQTFVPITSKNSASRQAGMQIHYVSETSFICVRTRAREDAMGHGIHWPSLKRLVSVMTVRKIHLIMYQQQQQLGAPRWADTHQDPHHSTHHGPSSLSSSKAGQVAVLCQFSTAFGLCVWTQ